MHAIVHAGDVQDRDGGALGMASLFGAFPFLLKLYADGGCQGTKFQAAVKKVLASVNVEIVKRSDQAKGFLVLPNRWISAGSLSAPSLGSVVAEGWPRIGSASTAKRLPSCASHPPDAEKAMQPRMRFADRL